MDTTQLINLKTNQITALANKANCSRRYVAKILNNERAANTVKSKAILVSAQILSNAIANAQKEVNKQFEALEAE